MNFGMLADIIIAEATVGTVVTAVDDNSYATEESYATDSSSGATLTDEEFWTIVNILSQPRTVQVLGVNGVTLREAA